MKEAFDAATTPLFDKMKAALKQPSLKDVPDLLEQGAHIDQTDAYGNTALMLAIISGSYTLVKYLIEKEANLDVTNVSGNTALILAVTNKRADVVLLLIEAGAEIGQSNTRGQTALDYAEMEHGSEEIAEILRTAPVDIHARRVAAEKEAHRHASAVAQQDFLKEKAASRKLKIRKSNKPKN